MAALVRMAEAASVFRAARDEGKSFDEARTSLVEWINEAESPLDRGHRKSGAFPYLYGQFREERMP
jgi:hypothetical protein